MAGWLRDAIRGNQAGRRVQAYLAVICAEPDESDVRWLAGVAPEPDEDHARWELRYARRAIGLLTAERDALDDRTASLVAREMHRTLRLDRNVAAGMVRVAERQFGERLRAFRAGIEARGTDVVEVRLARVLLAGVGATAPDEADLAAARACAARYLTESSDALRAAFGLTDLPPDAQPSVWRARQTG